MPERSNGAVSKTVDPRKGVPGFESLSFRKPLPETPAYPMIRAFLVFRWMRVRANAGISD